MRTHLPHSMQEKVGFVGAFISFLIFAANINCDYPLKSHNEAILTSTPKSMFGE